MNNAFQTLKGRLNMPGQHNEVVDLMRRNLLERNDNNNIYTLQYTQEGHSYDINTCSVEELLKIDGDMNPMGM